jgi:hypothetical protein
MWFFILSAALSYGFTALMAQLSTIIRLVPEEALIRSNFVIL